MLKKKANKIICRHTENTYKKIEVASGKCRYNYRCQMNATHEAIKGSHKKLAMVICTENGWPYIHFINYNKGVFTDNTLGHWSAMQDYYFVRWIKEKEFYGVNEIFTSFRVYLRGLLPWWVRLLNKDDF